MNKEDLKSAIAEYVDLPKTVVTQVIDGYVEIVTSTLAKHEDVSIPGFATMTVSHRAAREGVNPRTKEKIMINACTVPKFKASKALKDRVNNKED
jgi:DNA-binding protein HU-beta